MAETAITLVAAGAQLDGGAGAAVDVTAAGGTLRLTLTVTAPTPSYTSQPPFGAPGPGEPTLDVVVETSIDGAAPWRELGSFQQFTKPGTERKVFAGADRFVRARWLANSKRSSVAAGFSFGVAGHAL